MILSDFRTKCKKNLKFIGGKNWRARHENYISMKKVGQKILQIQKQKKLTQEQLAEAVNVSTKTISNWINGKDMTVGHLIKLCEILKITPNYLLNFEDAKGYISVRRKDVEEKLSELCKEILNSEIKFR